MRLATRIITAANAVGVGLVVASCQIPATSNPPLKPAR